MDINILLKKLGWRQGQFLFNFLAWTRSHRNEGPEHLSTGSRMADPFHWTDEKFEKLVAEYQNTLIEQLKLPETTE